MNMIQTPHEEVAASPMQRRRGGVFGDGTTLLLAKTDSIWGDEPEPVISQDGDHEVKPENTCPDTSELRKTETATCTSVEIPNALRHEDCREVNRRRTRQDELNAVSALCGPKRRVLRLASLGRWELLSSYLSTPEGTDEALKTSLVTDPNGRTALHLACCCNAKPGDDPRNVSMAPVKVMQRLMEVNPLAVKMVDFSGRTPLHLAAAAATSSATQFSAQKSIDLLLRRFPGATKMQDKNGMSPLMLLCKNLRSSEKKIKNEPRSSLDGLWTKQNHIHALLQVIRLLHRASPDTVLDEDRQGTSALEHAIMAGADVLIVRSLIKVTGDEAERLYKANRRRRFRNEQEQEQSSCAGHKIDPIVTIMASKRHPEGRDQRRYSLGMKKRTSHVSCADDTTVTTTASTRRNSIETRDSRRSSLGHFFTISSTKTGTKSERHQKVLPLPTIFKVKRSMIRPALFSRSSIKGPTDNVPSTGH